MQGVLTRLKQLDFPKAHLSPFAVYEQQNMPALKSSHFAKSNDLGGYCSGPVERSFDPFT